MAITQLASTVYVAGVGNFGSATELEGTGIELAIVAHGRKGFPHTALVEAVAIALRDDSADWFLVGSARLVVAAFGAGKTFMVADEAGGNRQAAFLVAAARCEALGESFDTARQWVADRLPDIAIPDALVSRGQALWP